MIGTFYVSSSVDVRTIDDVLTQTTFNLLFIILESAATVVADKLAQWAQCFGSAAFQSEVDNKPSDLRDLVIVTKLSLIHI